MPELTEQEERAARLKLAEQYPPEDGPYWIEDENGHQSAVTVVKPAQKFLGGKELALDENGGWRKPVPAAPKAAKKTATAVKEA